MDKDYKKAFENILKGKLYYKNSNEYHQANDIIYNHPFIQDLIKKAERLEAIENADDNSILHALNETSKYIDKFVNTEYQKNNYKKVFEPVLRNYILKSQQKAKELEELRGKTNTLLMGLNAEPNDRGREERRKVYKEGYEQGRFDERMDSIDNRPPTEKEVCEALSEYLGETIVCNEGTNEFMNIECLANDIDKTTHIQITKLNECNNTLKIITYLPSRLITMIGRFYEKESEVNK
jgi:hypothetical protein